MARIGMGLVGAGFVGPHHVDAVRRLGFVDIVAVAGSTEASGRQKAEALGARRGYGSYQALIDDPDVHVVHNATPNYLHYEVTSAALPKGKHVVSDKPLAMTAAESRQLVDEAKRRRRRRGRDLQLSRQPAGPARARAPSRGGEIGTPRFVYGHYLQDWLLHDTDYSWRLDPEKGGASSALGDIGSHWCDLAQHLTGLTITQVLGDMTTVCRSGRSRAVARRHSQRPPAARWTSWTSRVEDLASVLVRFENGAKGTLLGRPGLRRPQERSRRRGVRLEERRCGGGRSIRTSCGGATATAPTRCCRRIRRSSTTPRRPYAHLPGGHQEAWADAFCNLMRDIYAVDCRRTAVSRAAAGRRDVRRRLPRQPDRRGDSRERRTGGRLDERTS